MGFVGFLSGKLSKNKESAASNSSEVAATVPGSSTTASGSVLPASAGGDNKHPPKSQSPPLVDDTRGRSTRLTPIPIQSLVRVYGSPLGPDLIPNIHLRSLDFNNDEIESIKAAFREFKDSLETQEKLHATLKAGPTGEYYEIAPFELPISDLNQLQEKLYSIAGDGDWRAVFLFESLKASEFAAGLGTRRQEVAFEGNMLSSALFDEHGHRVGGAGYAVRSVSEITRYRNLFEK